MGIVFVGTPQFAVPSLRRLHANGYEISAVVTQPDRPAGRGRRPLAPPVKETAVALDVPVLQPASLRERDAIEHLSALSPEVMVAVAYGQILRPEVLEIAPKGVLNVHPSLLPRWRGASPIAGAILGADEETGVTIMLMDAGMDTGPILAQRRHPISLEDTTGSLTDALAELGADLLVDALPRWLSGEIDPVPQDESRATITRLVTKEDGSIDWSLGATDIWRRIRAYNPWPGAFASLNGETIKIWRAWPLDFDTEEAPGTIMLCEPSLPETERGGFAVQTGDGVLAVRDAQRQGRRRMSSAELLRGMPGIIGRRLGK